MEAESAKCCTADVDFDAAVPVAFFVTSAGGDEEDVIDAEGHLLDAPLAQSSLQRLDGLGVSRVEVVVQDADELAGWCVHAVQDAASSLSAVTVAVRFLSVGVGCGGRWCGW
jgi:hypothetical protein